MIVNQLHELYSIVGQKTGESPIEVKRCVTEVLRIVKEAMSTYPTHPAILLNKFGTISVKPSSLKNMIKRRIMSDEQRTRWEEVLNSVVEYKNNRKTKKEPQENVGQEISEQELHDGSTGEHIETEQ